MLSHSHVVPDNVELAGQTKQLIAVAVPIFGNPGLQTQAVPAVLGDELAGQAVHVVPPSVPVFRFPVPQVGANFEVA